MIDGKCHTTSYGYRLSAGEAKGDWLWHLIAEWGVKPKQADWQRTLEESINDFEARRSAP